MSRKELVQKAEKHFEFLENLTDDLKIITDSSINQTKIFGIKVGVPCPLYKSKYDDSQVTVEQNTIVPIILDQKTDGLISILNVGSMKNPGGKWLKGYTTQEESIVHASTLYLSLVHGAKEIYDRNDNDPKGGYYQDLIVYSPNVIMLKDDDGYALKNPKTISVITVPAVNALRVCEHDMKKHKNLYDSMEQIKKIMESRCTAVLKVAAKYNTEVLILGAFGCDEVFKNNPNDIAWVFDQLLKKTFKGVFKKVIFCIPDEENLEIFQSII